MKILNHNVRGLGEVEMEGYKGVHVKKGSVIFML